MSDAFEKKIAEIIADIRQAEEEGKYEKVHQKLLKKRLEWYENNKENLNLSGTDVRKAYEMVLFRYMNITPEDVPTTYEDERKITWISFNPCPVLEACNRLDVDTRRACKEGWEKSVQAMIEKINPNLRFSRNYEILRPHGEYCEETIELIE